MKRFTQPQDVLGAIDTDRALSFLSVRQRQVVELVMGNYTQEEIGALLGVSKGTVDTHLRRARKKIKKVSVK